MNELLNNDLFLNRIQTRKRFPRILNDLYNEEISRLEGIITLINSELENN